MSPLETPPGFWQPEAGEGQACLGDRPPLTFLASPDDASSLSTGPDPPRHFSTARQFSVPSPRSPPGLSVQVTPSVFLAARLSLHIQHLSTFPSAKSCDYSFSFTDREIEAQRGRAT